MYLFCRIQEIFEWIFEVEEDAEDEDPGRIIINIEYEMNSKKEETYGSTDNRVVARVHIQHDNVLTIVPVIKVRDNLQYHLNYHQTKYKSEIYCLLRLLRL